MLRALLGNTTLPAYVKIAAAAILVLTYVGALAVAAEVYISEGPNAQIPTLVAVVLGSGIGLALNVLGLHSGASIIESATPTTSTVTRTTSPTTTATTTTITPPTGGV